VEVTEEKPVSLANLVWALATAGVHPKEEAVHVIGDVATATLGQFKANELSITMWAFARLGCFHERLFSAAMLRLSRDPAIQKDMHSQGITNILWALSRLAEHQLALPSFGSSPSSVLTALVVRGLGCLVPTCLRLVTHMSSMEFSSTRTSLTKLEAAWGSCTDAATSLLAAMEGLTRLPAAWPSTTGSTVAVAAVAATAAIAAAGSEEGIDGLEGYRERTSYLEPYALAQEQGATEKPLHEPRRVCVDELLASAGGILPASALDPAYIVPALCGSTLAQRTARPEEKVAASVDAEQDGAAAEDTTLKAQLAAFRLPAKEEEEEKEALEEEAREAQAVALSVVPEFSEVHAEDAKAGSVTVAVEIESLAGHEEAVVSVEVCTDHSEEHCSSFVVNSEGLYRLSVPPRSGKWEMRLFVRDASGALIAQVLHIPFVGCSSPCLEIDEVQVQKGADHCSNASDLGSTCASLGGSHCQGASSHLEEPDDLQSFTGSS